MEVCILKFSKAQQAEEALAQVIGSREEQNPWLHEIGIIKRPLLGRVSIRATYGEGPEIKEGDVASTLADAGKWTGYLIGSLAGPLRARIEALRAKHTVAPIAKEIEKQLLGIDDIKLLLPRGSSALVLVGASEICDLATQWFAGWHPEVFRRDLSAEVRDLLERIHRESGMGVDAAAQ